MTSSASISSNRREQKDELEALMSIFGPEDFSCTGVGDLEGDSDPVGCLTLRLQLDAPLRIGPISVAHLPPLQLRFALPGQYPAHAGPQISVVAESAWLALDAQRRLVRRLRELSDELRGDAVLFALAQFVQVDAAAFLGLNCEENCDTENTLAAAAGVFAAADARRRAQLFANETVACGICLAASLGARCFRFDACRHEYCRACLTAYLSLHIAEANVVQVTCPNPLCKKDKDAAPLSPETVALILPPSQASADLVVRYTNQLETHRLLQQPNLTYCPRKNCNAPTLKDPEEEKLCVCSKCGYAFCFFCNRTWHGYASYCQIRHLETIATEYSSAASSPAHRKLLELKYGKKVLERVVREIEEEKLNSAWMNKNSQACPNCTCRVERSEGCCHMTCKVCDVHFCFLCGQKLNRSNPYAHFNTTGTPCFGKLFYGTINPNEYDPANDPELMNPVVQIAPPPLPPPPPPAIHDEYIDIPDEMFTDFMNEPIGRRI